MSHILELVSLACVDAELVIDADIDDVLIRLPAIEAVFVNDGHPPETEIAKSTGVPVT